jgi:replication initiation protein RepC
MPRPQTAKWLGMRRCLRKARWIIWVGRRPMSLAWLAAQNESREIPEGKAVDKWQLYRWLCEGKSLVGIGDRSLAVLAGLLSFYPDNELSEENGLIVFPSNKQLSLRAHGMADTTLRRHLSALLDCGLILRRDSPNGKRYARKRWGRGLRGCVRVLAGAAVGAR